MSDRLLLQMWWKDMKMRVCIIVGIILLLVVIIVPSGMSSRLIPLVQVADFPTSCCR